MLEIFVSLCYAMIFIILNSYVWFVMVLLFLGEMAFTIMLISNAFMKINRFATYTRIGFALLEFIALLAFWFF